MKLSDKLTELSGVGEAIAKKFSSLGINNVEDLLTYYPRKYNDFSHVVPINKTKPGAVSIKAKISHIKSRRARHGLHITEAICSDETGSIYLVWFNQPYRANSIKEDAEYYISGEFGLHRQRMSMINPSVEMVSSFPINTARIVPVYRESKGLTSIQIRRAIKPALVYLKLIKESLPVWLLEEYNLISSTQAIETMHFPISGEELAEAKHRIAFEEVFDLSLAALLNKNELLSEKALSIKFKVDLAKDFVKNLPFSLTDEQKLVAWQILQDIEKTVPMNRLLEGDVGTGKTVVATMAAYMTMNEGFQVALMAPTELLARQHADTIYEILKPFKLENKVDLIIGSHKSKQKEQVIERLNKGEIGFIIGTHSLIQEKVSLKNLGLIIIDEQHRFGVKQRQALMLKAGHMPHMLSMTATPIPRSLQLTLYGDLDISVIKKKPYSDLAVKTKIVSLNQRTEMYESFIKVLQHKKQIFIVCPLISDSAGLPFRSAEKVYSEVSKGVYKNFNVGLLHSKLKNEEKEKIMKDFVARKIDVLVATTIIEVGVNVPNASVMVIESAERFGLAQVHQLRGRVGRNHEQGYCYLLQDDNTQPSQRLRALETTTDGFKLAELDLQIRGPGVIYGVMQHGHDELDLKVAKLTDQDLIIEARRAAGEFIDKKENLLQYIQLNKRVERIRSVTSLN
jgi:ATP-dependent DNA helicase RecG